MSESELFSSPATTPSALDGSFDVDTAEAKCVHAYTTPPISKPETVAADESDAVSYFCHLVAVRDSLDSNRASGLVKAYSDIVCRELQHPLADPSIQDVIDLSSGRIGRQSDLFRDIKNNIHRALQPLDTAIWWYLGGVLDKSDVDKLLARQPNILASIVKSDRSQFSSDAFSQNPSKYLSQFIPTGVKNLDNEYLNWRSYLADTSPPLLKHFVKHDLASTKDWCSAKRYIACTFHPVGRLADSPIIILDTFADCWSAVRYFVSRVKSPRTVIPWLVANCTDWQQQELVQRLEDLKIGSIANYNFGDLVVDHVIAI